MICLDLNIDVRKGLALCYLSFSHHRKPEVKSAHREAVQHSG
jgi:hypothetical protein